MISIYDILLELALTDIPASDKAAYLKGMAKGADDKLFFLNQIKPDLIVDFGSADGYILNKISEQNKNITLVGFDISPEMVDMSNKKYSHITFTDNWSKIESTIKKFKNPTILLSSVIHEVYSYSSKDGVHEFWNRVFGTGFKYVVIRDTIPGNKIENKIDYSKDLESVKKIVDPEYLEDYENKWGPLEKSYKNFVRFVLMYRYKSNWSRESLEDYLPLTYENLVNAVIPEYTQNNYSIIYQKRFKFKPIERSFSKDFGINLRHDLHLKMILKRN